MMEQCEAGGFNAPVIASNTAASSSIASAAPANMSWWGTGDNNFDIFAVNWIAAQFGHNSNGSALAYNPDANGNGVVEAEEAFNYAVSQDTADSPTYDESSEAGGDITLGQHHIFWWLWCRIWILALEKYYQPHPPNPPDPEFYVKLNKVLPEVQKLVLPKLTRGIMETQSQTAKLVEKAVAKAFKGEQ